MDPDVLAGVAREAARDSGGVPVELLGDFLAEVGEAVGTGEPIPASRVRAFRRFGDRAAQQGVALRALLDLYLSAAWRLWPSLPPVAERADADAVARAGSVVLHAVDDVVAALTEGYQLARRALTRAQDSARREFVDDLLTGTSDVVGLLHRASGFGLDLAGPHAVAVVAAERPFDDGSPLLATLDRAVQGLKGDAQALLASKQEKLVVVFAAPDRAAVEQVVGRVSGVLDGARGGRGAVGDWRLGVGRPAVGADGVVASYGEAREALELADRLDLPGPIVDARELLVHRVLLRDRTALRDLVTTTLGGLLGARGGAAPLVETLRAFFDSGQNAAACARALHLSVRAVTYRLDRVRELTGLSVDDPADRQALQVAVLGARLLSWPTADA